MYRYVGMYRYIGIYTERCAPVRADGGGRAHAGDRADRLEAGEALSY